MSHKQRIIVAEDSPSQRGLLVFELERNGFEVIEAEDGQQAYDQYLKMIEAGTPADLICTDGDMPNVDGRKLISMIKEHATTHNIQRPPHSSSQQ